MVTRSTAAGDEYPVLERGGACLACKRRKKRCDGQKPICGQCTRLGVENECTFAPTNPAAPTPKAAANHARNGSDNSQSSNSYRGSPSTAAASGPSRPAEPSLAYGASAAPRHPEIYLSTPEGEAAGGSVSPASGGASSICDSIGGGSSSSKRKRWSSGEEEYDHERHEDVSAAGGDRTYVVSSSGPPARPFLKVSRSPPRLYATSSGAPSTYASSEPSPRDAIPPHLYGPPPVYDSMPHRIIPPQLQDVYVDHPSMATHERLLESFILHRERCGVEIDPDAFRQRMALPANSPGAVHPVLITAVYMTACYFEHLNGLYGWGDRAEEYYMDISQQLMTALHSPNMNNIDDIIRASGLLCWYGFVRGRVVEANYHASGALRLIGNKTINSIDGRPPSSTSPVSPGTMVKYEERLAIFWQIYMLDRYPSLLSHSDPTIREEMVENLLPRSFQSWMTPRLDMRSPVKNNLPMFDPQIKPQSDLAVRIVGITALERAVRLSRTVRHAADRAPHLLASVLRDLESLAGMLEDLQYWIPPLHASNTASPSSSTVDSPLHEEISLLLQQPVPKVDDPYVMNLLDPQRMAGHPAGVHTNPFFKPDHSATGLGLQLQRPSSPFTRPNLIYAHSAMYAAIAIVKQCAAKLETMVTPPVGHRRGLLDHAPFVRDTSLLSTASSIVKLLNMLGSDFSVMKEMDITIAVTWDVAAKVLANHVRNAQHNPAIDQRGQFVQQAHPQSLSEPYNPVSSGSVHSSPLTSAPTTPTATEGWYGASVDHQRSAGSSIPQLVQQYYALNSALDRFQATYSVIRYIRSK